MMGFDVNSQGTSAMADLPPSGRSARLPPKPSTISTPAVNASEKLAAVTSSISSTPMSSNSGAYSLYSLIKKQSQNTPAASQKPVTSIANPSVILSAKNTASAVPVDLQKKHSGMASLTAEKLPTGSAADNHVAVSFANPSEKPTAVDNDFTSRQRFVVMYYTIFYLPFHSVFTVELLFMEWYG